MPRHENAQLHNIHFITCSNQVAVLDMASPVVADLKMLEKGIVTYDACLKKDVLLLAPTMAILSDNPRHSELLNHAGGSANKYCRMCMVRSLVNIPSDASCSSVIWPLFLGWQECWPYPSLRRKDQGECPIANGENHQQCYNDTEITTYDPIWNEGPSQPYIFFGTGSLQVSGDHSSAIVSIAVQLLFYLHVCYFTHRSTPVETLHTILLGPYKYLLKTTMSTLSAQQKQEILARMTAFNHSGFDGKVLGNIVYHHKSFVGRDYKAWAQQSLFIIGPYLSDAKKQVWLWLSKVCIQLEILKLS